MRSSMVSNEGSAKKIVVVDATRLDATRFGVGATSLSDGAVRFIAVI